MNEIELSRFAATLQEILATWGLRVVGAAVVLLAGRMVAGWIRRAVRRGLERAHFDPTLAPFVANLVFSGLIVLVLLSVAGVLGIQTTSFIAILGAAGLAVALAFQGTLSNFSSGVMLLTFRPFRVGDFVDAGGVAGTVREIGVFFSTLSTPDNVRIIVPNTSIATSTIRNFSANETRRIDLVIGVSYDDDLGVATDTIRGVLARDGRVLEDPAPVVAVSELGDSSVDLVVRPWVKSPDYWATRWDLTRGLKEALEAAGCSIPYPQRDVHLYPRPGAPAAAAAAAPRVA